MAIPKKDAELIPYGSNFSAVLAANPATYLQQAATATAVTTAYEAYAAAQTALATARENGVRSEQQTANRDDLKKTFVQLIRPVYAFVQDSQAISDAAKIALGVHVRDGQHGQQDPPAYAPLLTVTRVNGNLVSIRLGDAEDPTRKGKAIGAIGASVFASSGETQPASPAAMVFQGNTGSTTFDVSFPATLLPGTKVWLSAMWFSDRKENSPACVPVETYLNHPSSLPLAA